MIVIISYGEVSPLQHSSGRPLTNVFSDAIAIIATLTLSLSFRVYYKKGSIKNWFLFFY